jgi:CheY-like chemotaxis protein
MATLADVIKQNLPFMRRYARAVSGEQRLGDGAVRACLQALLERPPANDAPFDRRLLFRTLHDVWSSPAPSVGAETGSIPIIMARLDSLSPRHRQALVLTMLEGFSPADAAYILRIGDEAEFAAMLRDARRELSAQPPTRILIIEDEPVIALDIASIVQQSGHEVVGIAATHAEAVALATAELPGLVLADIQLADDSSGIEAVKEILASHSVPVIFVTAYPNRLLTGDKVEPAFLITKPFEAETLSVTISQALSTRRPAAERAA